MLKSFIEVELLLLLTIANCEDEKFFYAVNTKKLSHTLDSNYIGLSIDPVILLNGFNFSESSLQLAKLLSPAYIRFAGPSTKFIQHEEESLMQFGNVDITPAMWFGINEWLSLAGLTPIFALNNAGNEWNSQSLIPLLEISNNFNFSCFWQLGYECLNKSEEDFVADLKKTKYLIETFPNAKNNWKLLANDFTACIPETSCKNIEEKLSRSIDGIILEPSYQYIPRVEKSKLPLWINCNKSTQFASFSSAISWAIEIGQNARNNFDVILYQPRIWELYQASPPFWVSLLYKHFMGTNVLELSALTKTDAIAVFGHCSKNQNDFVRSGAVTILVTNNSTQNHTVFLKLGGHKTCKIYSYLLRSENETEIYLNEVKLSLESFREKDLKTLAKIRWAKINNHVSLPIPGKSIGFFVISDARLLICDEGSKLSILDEIAHDQRIEFTAVEPPELAPRVNLMKKQSLQDIRALMAQELEADQEYFHRKRVKLDERRQSSVFKPPKTVFDLELTDDEIKKVLTERAKRKALARNLQFSNHELDEIAQKVSAKYLNSKDAMIRLFQKKKREAKTRNKKDINWRFLQYGNLKETSKRKTRDINYNFLNRRVPSTWDLSSDESLDCFSERKKKTKTIDDRRKRETLSFNKRYESLTENLRAWTPADIVKFNNIRTRKSIDTCPENDVRLIKDKIKNCSISEKGSNIQKISDENLDRVWSRSVKKLSGLFQGLSSKVKNYIIGEIYK